MKKLKRAYQPFIVESKFFFVFIIVLVILLFQTSFSIAPVCRDFDITKKSCAKTKELASLKPDPDEGKDKEETVTPAQRYYPIIVKVSLKYEVDPLLIKAVIHAESGFNANAVSRVGAQGLMQLMPRTAKSLGVKDAFNPEHNIDGGVKYLKRLLDKYNGNIEFALAAYNAGTRNVFKYKGVPPYAETKKYIKKVCTLHEMYKKSGASGRKEPRVSRT